MSDQERLLMSPDDFARLNGIHRSAVMKCIHGTSKTFPPLKAKRVGTRYFITAEAAKAWRDRMADA